MIALLSLVSRVQGSRSKSRSLIITVWYGTITFQLGPLNCQLAVLKDVLFRENLSLCIGLFDTDEIATADLQLGMLFLTF